MGWVGDAIPGQRLRERVLQRRGLEAELGPGAVYDVTGRTVRTRPIWAGSLRQVGERHRIKVGPPSHRARDRLDESAEAHALEPDVVCPIRRLLAEVAGERACETDVLDPR